MSDPLAETAQPETFACELDAHIAESMNDPEYAAAFRAAEERHARLVERPCCEGNCVELYDPETGESESGWGPVGCPCDDDDHVCLPRDLRPAVSELLRSLETIEAVADAVEQAQMYGRVEYKRRVGRAGRLTIAHEVIDAVCRRLGVATSVDTLVIGIPGIDPMDADTNGLGDDL